MNELEIRRFKANQGWKWIRAGAALLAKNPAQLIMMLVALFVLLRLLLWIPYVGPLILLTIPIALVGMIEGCRAIEFGKPLAFGYLLAGFTRNTGALLVLGSLSVAFNFLVLIAMSVIGGDSFQEVIKLSTQQKLSPENARELSDAASGIFAALLVGWVLSIAVMMALWFAPLLVYYHNLKPHEAMLLSFTACRKNLGAFAVYGGVIFSALVMAMPFAMSARLLDLGLLLLAPVVIPSILAAYTDIFVDVPDTPEVEEPAG
jgi:hypothetical protein